jgi:hypothetical protein
VKDYLAPYKADVKRKLQNAYAMTDADARLALDRLHRELMDLNPSAARSLEEGMEEHSPFTSCACRTMCCTNVIESAFSIVETAWRNVKRWLTGDQIERWVGSGLWSPSANSEKLSAIARFRYCYLRWPTPFPRNRLRKEPPSRSLSASSVANFQRSSGQSPGLSG